MTLHPRYLIAAATIFLIEVVIAMGYPPIPFVRHSLGDVFVIALVYCVIRGVTNLPRTTTAILSLCIGIAVECLQFLHLADRFELAPGSIGHTVLGNTFSTSDLLMYAIGAVGAWWVDGMKVES